MKNNVDWCRRLILAGGVISLLLAPSCMKNKPDSLPENLEWNPSLALPIGEDRFGLNNESSFDTLLLENDSVTGMPGWIRLNEVALEKTSALDLSIIRDNLDKLNRIMFRMNSSNQFPNIMYLQAYFSDQGGAYLDSIFSEGPVEIPAGSVNNDREPVDPGTAVHDAILEAERIAIISQAQSLKVRAFFLVEGVDTTLLSFYPSFNYDLQSGWMLDMSLTY
jgi:hypothetical protein